MITGDSMNSVDYFAGTQSHSEPICECGFRHEELPARLSVLQLHPGDIVVIETDRTLTPAERHDLFPRMPEGVQMWTFEAGITLSGVLRLPDASDAEPAP